MKLLITSGGTREAIDPVRYLSNGSTGKTGASLATSLVALGHEVTLLHGVGAILPSENVEREAFFSAEGLRSTLEKRLAGGGYAAVIMAAAVSDYRPAALATEKLSSDKENLTLNLVRNPKILPQLRGFSPCAIKVIGFKLTVGADAEACDAAVRDQFAKAGVDAVVHNDLAEMQASPQRLFRWSSTPSENRIVAGLSALAEVIDELIRRDNP